MRLEVDRLSDDGSMPSSGSFELLYQRFFPQLVARCRALVGDQALAEDVAQETLLRAMIRFKDLDLDRAWSWLRTVATHIIVDHVRHHRREVPYDADRREEAVPDAEVPVDVAAAMSALPSRQRIALGLRYLEDWDPAEIAAYLDVGEGALKQLLFRGRRKLRAEYTRLAEGAAAIPILAWRVLASLRRRSNRGLRRGPTWRSVAGHVVAVATLLSIVGSAAVSSGSAQRPIPAIFVEHLGANASATNVSAGRHTSFAGMRVEADGRPRDRGCIGTGRRTHSKGRVHSTMTRAWSLADHAAPTVSRLGLVAGRKAARTGSFVGCAVRGKGSPALRALEEAGRSVPVGRTSLSPTTLRRMLMALTSTPLAQVLAGSGVEAGAIDHVKNALLAQHRSAAQGESSSRSSDADAQSAKHQ